MNEGRSPPGKIQKNDEVKEWKQLEWMTKTGR
ncbi:hypothetical protein CLV98_10556 [Dyadobacter jejuensis]|uniref:Uncharacterized protein n=1 Tax=Dyadobacter jejuensis TaxID=1082580 RepID=A0A316AJM8_9BACT|nr:hypothetical protein CLV98_10556 [Dyadobacter jejuensis]